MILYYFPIAQNTGPVELRFGSNQFSGSLIISDYYLTIGITGQVWYLIVSIPDLCTLT